jgi:hypothetical protein
MNAWILDQRGSHHVGHLKCTISTTGSEIHFSGFRPWCDCRLHRKGLLGYLKLLWYILAPNPLGRLSWEPVSNEVMESAWLTAIISD